MKNKKIIIGIGILLIAARLFFPVKEYYILDDAGSRLSKEAVRRMVFEKEVMVSKTVFQVLGIIVLTGGFVYLIERKNE